MIEKPISHIDVVLQRKKYGYLEKFRLRISISHSNDPRTCGNNSVQHIGIGVEKRHSKEMQKYQKRNTTITLE